MEESTAIDSFTTTLLEADTALSPATLLIKFEHPLKLKAIAVIPAIIAVLTFFMKNLQKIILF